MPDPVQPTQPQGKRLAKPAGALALILAGVYAVEGGYVDNPKDPGGATRYGVTEQVARQYGYSGSMKVFPRSCDAGAKVCADQVYIADYVDRPGYMPLIVVEPAVADKLVNIAVNMGPARPNRWFRESVGVLVSGLPLGAPDLAAYQMKQARQGVTPACEATLRYIAVKQEGEYLRLIRGNPALATFRNGWVKRARNLHPSGIPCGARP